MPILNSIKSSQENYINFFKKNFFMICNKGDLFIDISMLLDNTSLDKLVVNKFDYHASSYVNKLIAKEIYSALKDKSLNAEKC